MRYPLTAQKQHDDRCVHLWKLSQNQVKVTNKKVASQIINNDLSNKDSHVKAMLNV